MNKAINHFKKNDAILFELAKNMDLTKNSQSEAPFLDLVESIINQQLSGKAAATIFSRFKKLFPNKKITPEKVARLTEEDIRNCGISRSKASYIKGIAKAIIEEQIILDSLNTLEDENVISELTKLKGVGRWTAEMYLMFTLARPDVFSADDIGIKNAMISIYKLDKNVKNEELEQISLKWSPFRTTACRILWRSLDS